jgi:hypothetical protein
MEAILPTLRSCVKVCSVSTETWRVSAKPCIACALGGLNDAVTTHFSVMFVKHTPPKDAMDLNALVASAFESLERGETARREGRLEDAKECYMVWWCFRSPLRTSGRLCVHVLRTELVASWRSFDSRRPNIKHSCTRTCTILCCDRALLHVFVVKIGCTTVWQRIVHGHCGVVDPRD